MPENLDIAAILRGAGAYGPSRTIPPPAARRPTTDPGTAAILGGAGIDFSGGYQPNVFGGVPLPSGTFGGGGGGGGAGIDPRYWGLLEQKYRAGQTLLGQQESLAQQGFGLEQQEAEARRQNMQRLLDLQKRRLMEQELPTALRTIGNEAAARGSFMSQARILGQKEAGTAARQQLAEASEQARGQTQLLNIGVQQAQLALQEQLARISANRQEAEADYQIALLRRG